jgi:hypothetical protein
MKRTCARVVCGHVSETVKVFKTPTTTNRDRLS